MITVEDYETIRRAYYLEKKSIRQIAREQHQLWWRKADLWETRTYWFMEHGMGAGAGHRWLGV